MDQEQELKSFEQHFVELKASVKHSFIVFVLLSVFFFAASEGLLTFMQQDLQVNLHGLTPFEVFNVRLSISAIMGLIFSMPVMLYSFISFAKPGLTSKEYKVLKYSFPVSYALFVSGSAFAYHVVFRNAVNFFLDYTQNAQVEVVWGLQNTLMLGARISIISGVLFQLPLIVAILEKGGLVTVEQLKEYRAYVIVGVLLVAAVATPPDMITQIGITLPIILLYELSIRIVERI